MTYTVVVHAIGEDGTEAFVGTKTLEAPTAVKAREQAIEALWADRLACASCRARATVVARAGGEGEPAALRAARSTRSYLEESRRASAGAASKDEWRWYRFWWTWTALRFSSTRQDRARAKLGSELFYRRIERIQAWRQRLLAGGVSHAA